jgi:GTP cyclohydrolase II
MTLRPDPKELAARARADLRMGVPVVLGQDGQAALVAAAETLSPERLAHLRTLGTPVLAITPRRAETLKARAYSDHVARITVPDEAGTDWIQSVADPADDLMMPLKGPFATLRGGDEQIARAATRLAKAAHLLPAAVVVVVADGHATALAHGLTLLDLTSAAGLWDSSALSRPGRWREEHYAIEIGAPRASAGAGAAAFGLFHRRHRWAA